MADSPKKKMKYSQNKGKYYGKAKQQFLAPGMRGFLATCNFREKDCVREAYNLLRAYADDLYGPEGGQEVQKPKDAPVEEAGDDIADQLVKEVNAVNAKQKKFNYQRFQQADSGASNCVFIRTTLEDPVELASSIVNDIVANGLQKTRFLLRLVPVETVCRIDDIEPNAGKLFDKYFLKSGCTYSIIFNRRFNNSVQREKIIHDLAELVASKNVNNRVDLKNPDKTIVVEIIKGLCLMSVITGYVQHKKYNLVELANQNQNTGEEIEKAAEDDVKSADTGQSSDTQNATDTNNDAVELADQQNTEDDEEKKEPDVLV